MDAFNPSSLALVELRELQRAILCLLHAGLFRAESCHAAAQSWGMVIKAAIQIVMKM